MATTQPLEVSTELAQTVQKLAEEENISVDELIATMTHYYTVEHQFALHEISDPDSAEIAAVNLAIEEAERPGAKMYTTQDILNDLEKVLSEEDK